MAARTKSPLRRFCRETLPLLSKAARGRRMLADVEQIVRTDRWNSFDKFHETTDTLTSLLEATGAATEVTSIPTGGPVGSGRWIIAEAADIRSATLDVTAPVRRRVLDYRDNPWHVIQWSAATPAGGVTGELVVIDTPEQLSAARPGSLAGKIVLTRMPSRNLMADFAAAGAVGVVTDHPVRRLPQATPWTKFGWGAVPIEHAARRLVGLALSQRAGDELRALIADRGPLTVRARVDIRHYVGSHDLVSGVVAGADDPQTEVWALAHSAEPGAIDNASGVATCVEIARMLEALIRRGRLRRPRRSIRLLAGYECYSFFHTLEHGRRFQTPLAGVCLDSVGSRPAVCDGRLSWCDTIAMSAGFVDDLGAAIFRETLRWGDPGYRLSRRPFVSTCDTLIGDPKYGFPCPWLTTHFNRRGEGFDGYHSSHDTPALLSEKGLAACAAGAAGYLYYLADAGDDELLELARTETRQTLRRLATPPREEGAADSRARARFLRDRHHESISRLARWIWGGDRSEMLGRLGEYERTVAEAAETAAGTGRRPRRTALARRVPRRTAPLTPQLENTPPNIAGRITRSRVRDWTLFWADGERTIGEITDAARCDLDQPLTVEQVNDFFEAHEQLGYVKISEPDELLSRARLIADLKALGLKNGMDVICHSSLGKIGHVRGGADTVVDAICAVIGKRGTLLAPSFNFGWATTYNIAATPGVTGAIPQAMLRRAEAVRSDHPTHPLAAIGGRAAWFCRDHVAEGIWSAESPIGRLIHNGGYILSLGVGQIYSTAYHVAEVSMPCKGIATFGDRSRVVAADGGVALAPSMAYRATACPVSAATLGEILDRKTQRLHGRVGRGKATLVKAIDLYNARRAQLKHVCPTCTVRPAEPKIPPTDGRA